MRISVNLATRPFIELRPLFARLRLAMLALAILAVALGFLLRSMNEKARAAQAQMDELKATTLQYTQERQRNEARMHQPQNMAVLERSQFLNAVFAQKSFSWTAVMMDLEKVLPSGVQVTSIEPSISKEGEVSIRLRVAGDRDKSIQLMRNLEASQRFIAPRLSGESAMAQDTGRQPGVQQPMALGTVEFEILSGYNPLPVAPMKRAKAEVADTDTDAAAARDAGPKTVSRRARGAKAAPPRQRHLLGSAR